MELAIGNSSGRAGGSAAIADLKFLFCHERGLAFDDGTQGDVGMPKGRSPPLARVGATRPKPLLEVQSFGALGEILGIDLIEEFAECLELLFALTLLTGWNLDP